MAVQRAVAERWKKVTGVTLVEAYGLTETSPAACINPLTLTEYNGSIGLPIPPPMPASRMTTVPSCRWARSASSASRARR